MPTTFTHELAKVTAQAKNLTVGVTPVFGTYTTTTDVSGDTVQLFKVDINQQVMMLRIVNEAAGANVTFVSGDGVDTDRYIQSTDASVADVNMIDQSDSIDPYPYPAADTVDIVWGGAGNPTTGKKVTFYALLANLPTPS